MITPRRTRLVRAASLHELRGAIGRLAAERAAAGGSAPLVVVPSRAAGRQLARTLEEAATAPACEPVDRDQLYERLRGALRLPPRRLNPFERDAIAQASARQARETSPGLPFRLRPALVAEMLAFYDLLRRQSQRVDRFEGLIEERLAGDAGIDPGAERMLRQTRFLASAFREYERRAAASDGVDEHALRARLLADAAPDPFRHVIVAVPDWIADPKGLFVADFDLLSRLPGLEAIDIVATEAVLGSGFHERLHGWLPGLEEMPPPPPAAIRPVLVTPPVQAGAAWFTHRDREAELLACARRLAAARSGDAACWRAAIVYRRPLPYLYLAEDTLGAEGLACELSDALPLAAEPSASALDLALDLVASDFSRPALVALLRSPHLSLGVDRLQTSALDRHLSARRYLGDRARLASIAAESGGELRGPLASAVAVCEALAPLAGPRAASVQLRHLAAFVQAHARPLDAGDPLAEREQRARARLTDGLESLAAAHAAHDDPPWTIDDVVGALRRWIEGETFVPAPQPPGGVQILDDEAVRFGAFEDLTLVGLVEGEWPDPPRRNIFYPPALMTALGWPSEKDRRAAEAARFIDLLGSASRQVRLSTITLDDEALVEASSILDEIPRAHLSSLPEPAGPEPPAPAASAGEAGWVGARIPPVSGATPAFHGMAGPLPPRAWSVSALETYLGCPFRFFAQHVLRLEEEPEDEEVMDPRRQGMFVHREFERFFAAWQAAGRRAITPGNIGEARALFTEVVGREVATLRVSDAEAALERTRLLGSPAAAGLGEAVLRMEAERPVEVVERLLEYDLSGPVTLETESGSRTVTVRGKADRLDLLADGTIRLIDYKLGWAPQRARALQLPIYGICAEQRLSSARGRTWRLGEAVYLAFKGARRVVPLFANAADRTDVLAAAQARAADALDRIGRGEFPPTPDDVYRCETCSFAAVCRKDYVGDV
ncbi:MAG: PD-(D/E)XK nuclease family protein [Acidobacteria bacterium]|nr:PD-(D/E)XK nuclease family protein [Acidobacteriota bacterium]